MHDRTLALTTIAALAAFASAATLPTLAQQPIDNQVGRVDNRVGGELYGGNQNATARYPVGQYRLLPSEERNAIRRSGMLPSEYQLNRAAYGPLPPEGTINYISRRSPLQRAMNLPEPQLANPGYEVGQPQPGQRLDAWPEPTPGGYPQTLRAGVAASTRVPGATSVNRPLVPRADLSYLTPPQPSNFNGPLPPIQPGPVEVEEATRGQGVPRPLQPSPPTTAPTGTSESSRPPQWVVPSLTGAPDRPLPTGEPPPATPAGGLLSGPPAR